MTPENEGPTEDALFDNAIEGTPAETTPAAPPPAPPEQQEGAPKDDAALKSETTPERPAVDDNAPLIPSWRLREITEERRQAQAERDALKAERDQLASQHREFMRRLAQLEKPAEQEATPDPLLDPKGYTDMMEARWEARLVAERRENSLQMAKRTYKEEFDQAYQAAQRLVDPNLRTQMQQSADPGETLIGWFRHLKNRAEFGDDPAAYRKKVRDEALADPEFRKAAMEAWREQAPAQSGGRPNVQLAPSLNGVSRSNAALRTALQGDMPDDALWDKLTT